MLKGMAALCVCVAFVSCSHDLEYDPSIANKQKELSYEQTFIKQFGQVSPNQEWDFTKSIARTRAGEEAAKIEELGFNTSGQSTSNYLWIWKWKYSDPSKGVLNQNTFDNLYNNNLDAIKSAIESAEYTDWNPSQYKNVYYRVFAVSQDGASKSYQRFGIHLPSGKNYWLAQGNPNKDDWSKGTLYMDHTRYLDFTQLPQGTSWFIISQKADGTTPNKKIKASEYELITFKEVTVNIDGKDYTFWAFNCNRDESDVADMILWVEAEKKPIEKIVEKRYMAEDLGGNGDIDFNDVVFDIVETSDGVQTCYLRALGGTLDLAIYVNNTLYWRKSTSETPKFDVKTMYNTGYNNTTIDFVEPIATFTVEGWDDNANNVSLAVWGDGVQNDAVTYIKFPMKGATPRMIAISTKKHWQKEKVGVPNMDWFYQLDEE